MRNDLVDRRTLVAGAAAASACAGRGQDMPVSRLPGDFPNYELHVAFDRDAVALLVRGTVTLPQIAAGETLRIALSDDAQDVRIWLAEEGGQEFSLIKQEDGVSELRRWRMTAPVGAPLPLRLAFSLRLERRTGSVFALTPELAFAAGTGFAWYPQIVDHRDVRLVGVGELSYDFGALVVISSGARVAADGGEVRFRANAPDYFSFAAGHYVASDQGRDRVRVMALEQRSSAPGQAAQMQHVLRVLETEFGPLPNRRFDLVEVTTEIARAAGFDGASLDGFMLLISDYFEQPFNTAFFGHEAAHQWWGGSVRRLGLPGAYLMDESLAQYGSLRAVEVLEGEAGAHLYRRIGYPGYYTEYSAFWYLARSLAEIDAPLAQLHSADPFVARRVGNSKGMIVWDMLARAMGRRRFSAFLSAFVRDHAYHRVGLDVFMQGLRDALGSDEWLVEQWFLRTGAPSFELEWRQGGAGVAAKVTQTSPYYRARLPIRVHGENGESTDAYVEISGANASVEFALPFRAIRVDLDPDFTILHWTNDTRARAAELLPYTRGDILLNQGDAAGAERLFQQALAERPPDGSELRFQLLRGSGDAALGADRPRDAVRFYREALEAAPVMHRATPEVWRSLGDAFRALNDTAGRIEAAEGQREAILQLQRPMADRRRRTSDVR